MKEGSHRARIERLRERERSVRKARHLGAWITAATTVATMVIVLLLRRELGRELAIGIAVAAAVFGLACLIVAKRVGRAKGRDHPQFMLWMGLATGFATAASIGVGEDEDWISVVVAGCCMGTIVLISGFGASEARRP